jgi:hypothetical protein
MGASRVFKQYTSLSTMLQEAYPEYQWEAWKFSKSGKSPWGHWQQKGNVMSALDRAEQQLGINQVMSFISNLWTLKFAKIIVFISLLTGILSL